MVAVVAVILAALAALTVYTLWSLVQAKLEAGRAVKIGSRARGKGGESETDKALRELTEFCDGDDRTENVLILYGTEYGFSKEVARKTAEELAARLPTVRPRVLNMLHHTSADLAREQLCLVCCSTTGDGVVPTDSKEFYSALSAAAGGKGAGLRFSVLALGDTGYPHFCRGGRLFSEAFELYTGSGPVLPMKEIDQEEWEDINLWIDQVAQSVEEMSLVSEDFEEDYLEAAVRSGIKESEVSISNPHAVPIAAKRMLSKVALPGDKETVHVEFDLSGSGIAYTCGDALAVVAKNDPDAVQQLIESIGADSARVVRAPGAGVVAYMPLEMALLERVDLKTVKAELVEAILRRITSTSDKDYAKKLFGPDYASIDAHGIKAQPEFHSFVSQRFIADVLNSFPSAQLSAQDVLDHARALIPRFYSISSSPLVEETRVSIAAAVVRYDLLGLPRRGVATTFLADRVAEGETARVYVQPNPNFRLPQDDERPIVMMGAGTGLAPFIGFLQERDIRRATGESLLFFGCRHQDKDFLYREELEQWASDGHVELYTAFSRDQDAKVYIQDRMEEKSERLWGVLGSGAHLYVCGDAKEMAKGVHDALSKIVRVQGDMSEAEAEEYLIGLEKEGRYQRDVWIS